MRQRRPRSRDGSSSSSRWHSNSGEFIPATSRGGRLSGRLHADGRGLEEPTSSSCRQRATAEGAQGGQPCGARGRQ
eukprot:6716364-Pyramimonas_sp.AAC.1